MGGSVGVGVAGWGVIVAVGSGSTSVGAMVCVMVGAGVAVAGGTVVLGSFLFPEKKPITNSKQKHRKKPFNKRLKHPCFLLLLLLIFITFAFNDKPL